MLMYDKDCLFPLLTSKVAIVSAENCISVTLFGLDGRSVWQAFINKPDLHIVTLQRVSSALLAGFTDCTAATLVPVSHGHIIAIAVSLASLSVVLNRIFSGIASANSHSVHPTEGRPVPNGAVVLFF